MFHLNTELLIDYWRARRGERPMPARADIDPADFAALMPQTFIAVLEADGEIRFRLAGEVINDLHGRALRGEAVAALWRPAHRRHLVGALEASLRGAEPLVVDAEGVQGDDMARHVEILFAPLTGPDGRADRFLGLYQPSPPYSRAAKGPVRDLAIRGVNGAEGRPVPPKLRLAVVDGRRIA